MARTLDNRATRATSRRATSTDFLKQHDDWDSGPEPKRDWKKLALVLGLGSLSWVATYVGMLELIQANMGDLPLVQKAIIGFAVAMLMTMIIWLLDQLFAPHSFLTKMSYVAGYLFLTLISVGFGFGFYWKVLESRSEATRSAESAISQVQSSLHVASTRLTQLQTTLEGLAIISKQKAVEERTKGTSCPNSSPGDGPRRKLRDDDAARFGFSSNFVKSRVASTKANMQALNADMQKVIKGAKSTFDPRTGTRNEFMRALNRKLNLTVTGFNAFRSDPQLKQIRADLAERSGRTTFPNGKGGTFSCPDAQLQAALRGVVRAIDQLPELQKPKIATVEGSEAVIEAFRRLTATLFGALQFKLPPSPEEMRQLQQKAVQSVASSRHRHNAVNLQGAGLSKRDYVPLAIALFVDLCLLLVSMGRPVDRLSNLVPKMRRAERGPVIQILSRFKDIHKDKEVRESFEIFRHVVFDWGGDYYVAVPLNAPYTAHRNMGGGQHQRVNTQVEDLQQEAHLLANLFASFEQEKIFSRVLVPLLSTKAIQKKLHRQGSKFAGSESFRVYKFRDGAWSEIILGAVMGAARRVEADKRRRRAEGEMSGADEPTLGGAFSSDALSEETHQNVAQDFASGQHELRPDDALEKMAQFGSRIAEHNYNDDVFRMSPAEDIRATTTDQDGASPPSYWTKPAAAAATSPAAHAETGTSAGGDRFGNEDIVPDEEVLARFGPYGHAASAELSRGAGGSGSDDHFGHDDDHPAAAAANNNTAPSAPAHVADHRAHAGNVIQLPSSQHLPVAPVPQQGPATVAGASTAFAQDAQVVAVEEANIASVAPGANIAVPLPQETNADLVDEVSPATVEEDGQASINVELRERTVTYSIPTNDARLPANLLSSGKARRTLAEALNSAIAKDQSQNAGLQLEYHVNEPVHAGRDSLVNCEQRDQAIEINAQIAEGNGLVAADGLSTGDLTVSVAVPQRPLAAPSLADHEQTLNSDLGFGEHETSAWSTEATVDINTSEISRRFAHGVKKTER